MDDKLTELVIGEAFKVHNQLGFGFLESVYEKALSIELAKIGIPYSLQSPIRVFYDDQVVGEFTCSIGIHFTLDFLLYVFRSCLEENGTNQIATMPTTKIKLVTRPILA